MERTLVNAKNADLILKYISEDKNSHYTAQGIQPYLFPNLSVKEVEFLFIWISNEFSKYVDVTRLDLGEGELILECGSQTEYFLSIGGVESIIKNEIEKSRIKKIETDKLEVDFKNATRVYESYKVTRVLAWVGAICGAGALILKIIEMCCR